MQRRLILLAILLGLTLVGVEAATRSRLSRSYEPHWSLVSNDLDGWRGKDTSFDPVYGVDPADSSLLRIYAHGERDRVIVYVGFYHDLATILEVHTPELCYPAQGWRISEVSKSTQGRFRGHSISAEMIEADKNGTKRLVTWWYNAGSHPFETRIRYVYAMLIMSMITGRTDGSLVRIESPIDEGGGVAAQARIEEFRKALLPELEKALP